MCGALRALWNTLCDACAHTARGTCAMYCIHACIYDTNGYMRATAPLTCTARTKPPRCMLKPYVRQNQQTLFASRTSSTCIQIMAHTARGTCAARCIHACIYDVNEYMRATASLTCTAHTKPSRCMPILTAKTNRPYSPRKPPAHAYR